MRLFIIILFVGLLTACNNPNEKTAKVDAYERVFNSGKIKVGYIAYPPSFIIDPNTSKYTGISNDVLQQAAQKLGIEIEYAAEVGWGDMIEAIKTEKIDIVITTVWPTAARGKHADFTNPIYYSTVKAYVRTDDSRFNNNITAADDSKITIAAMDGEMSLSIAKADFPRAKINSLGQNSSVSELALMVASNKADITFLEPAIAEEFISKNPNTIKAIEGTDPVRIFPNVYMLGKGETRLRTTLNSALGELQSAKITNQIINKYEKYPDSFGRVK